MFQIYLKMFKVIRDLLGGVEGMRPIHRLLPSDDRCKACLAPFKGIFSIPFRIVQIRPSRKNPHLCTM